MKPGKAATLISRAVSVFAILLVAATHAVEAQDVEPWDGSVEQKVTGLVTVWSEAKFNFPFFDQRPELNWDEKFREYLPRAIAAENIDTYYDVLSEFAAQLKDGHTGVNRPGGPLNSANDWPPVEVQVVDGKFLIARVGEAEEIEQNHVYPGLQITGIEGVEVAEYFQNRIVKFDSRGTQHADEAISSYKLLLGPKNSAVALKVRDLDGKERIITLTRNSEMPSGERFLPRLLDWYLDQTPIEFQQLNDAILYIRIANFGSESVVSEFLEEFDRVEWNDVNGVVLDIRFNPGGDDQFAWPIIGCFIGDAVKSPIWKSPKYVPAKLAWGFDPEWEQGFLGDEYIQPRDGKRFLGPLVILIGHATYSTAEDFVIPLDFSDRAILVGETTAGSTGNPHRVQLPGGGNFRVVTLRTLYPDLTEWVGKGIHPDIGVHQTQQDIVEGKDTALQKGIELISKHSAGNSVQPQ